ncbi:alpha-2-macroglobulin family protein, partial [Psychrosphaera sp. I2R16]
YFGISQQNGKAVDGAWVIAKSGKNIWFPYVDPEVKYKVTIYQGLKAINNRSLLRTQHADVVTSRVTPSFNFDTSGAFLTQGLGNGLPVVTVNVNDVDINFYQVREKDQQRFLEEMSHRQYYWGIERVTQFADLVYSGRFEFDGEPNTRTKSSIDIEGIQQLKPPGIYLAIMAKAGTYSGQQMMWFSVTDIGLHARFYEQQLDVYASSLLTGKPIEQAQIQLVNDKGEILQQVLTSPSGEASFTTDLKSASLIVAQNKQHFSVVEINKPALDLSDFDLGMRANRAQELFIYAPRDLYRPGEFVDFNGLLRDADGKLVATDMLSVSIKSPTGAKIKSFKWHGNDMGYFHYQWQIPSSAQVGNWRFEVESITKQLFVYDFKVEEFLPERLKLTFNPEDVHTTQIVDKWQQIKVPVLGEYLFGAPASNNRLSTDVSVSLWRKPVERLPDFEFGDIKQSGLASRESLDDIQLNEQGIGELYYKGDWSQLHSPLNVKFISSLFETGGRPVSRSYSTLVWPSDKMIGIRADFGDNNPEANSKVRFDLVKASINGDKHPATNLDVKLIKEDRRYFWVYSDQQGWHYKWNDNEFTELTRSVDIAKNGLGTVEFPVSYGRYRIEVRDPADNLLTSKQFYAGWNWYEDWQNSRSGSGAARPDKITMALDKGAYEVGDNVEVNIIPPEAGEAIVIVEGDTPLWSTRLFIPAEGATVTIPVANDWQEHNIYISAVVLQPGDKLKALTPKRSFGLVHLPLARASRQLAVEFDVAEKVLPNKVMPVNVKVTDPRLTGLTDLTAVGEQSVFMTLAAVDVGVLSVSNFESPDPFDAFFGQRRYSVDSRDVYSKVIEMSQSTKAKMKFGGDDDLTRGGDAPQSDVQIVSLFSGLVKLDENLEAQIPVNLPDFNGRIKLMALAFSADAFGHGEQEVTVAAPVVTQIAMPRFLAKGDKTRIALDVTNLSGERQELQVTFATALEDSEEAVAKAEPSVEPKTELKAELSTTRHSPVKAFDTTQTIVLDNGAKRTLLYDIEVTNHTGVATFELNVSGDQLAEAIQRQWTLGARPAYPATFTNMQKVLNNGERFTIDETAIESLIDSSVVASVAISPSANIDLNNQLDQLLQYPYGCLEQTSSRAYPLLFATPVVQQAFGINAIDESKRVDMINKGFERLASLQLSSGGFGLWRNTSDEEHWLTAYVADFLLSARAMGFAVPEDMLKNTLTRLQQYLARSGRFYNERWSNDPGHYHFAYKAYAAYVLARVNQVPLGTLRSLATNNSRYARTGLSQTHLAIALIKMGDKRRGEQLMEDALANLPKQRQQYLGDYGSQTRDLALMIHLMLTHKIAESKAISLSFTLAEQLINRQYLSTQERNALFLAGIALKEFDGESWNADLIIGSATTKLSMTSGFQTRLGAEDINNSVSIESAFAHPLLANINISGYGKTPPEESANGLSIQRHWLNLKGQEIDLKQAEVGELFLVQLEVNAEQRTPDALIIDLLPAGFELENQNLEHAIKLDEIKVDGKSIAQWLNRNPTKYQEYRDDRFVAAAQVRKRQTVNLFYLVRAVTPGTYNVPSPLVEDMYRPEIRGIGKSSSAITIVQK